MKKCTAIVFSGGGSRGALQVGAMRALLEAGIVPDLLVGTSIGAVNAAGLALWGVDLNGVDALERAWKEVSSAQLLDSRVSQLILRAMMGHPSDRARKKAEDFFVAHGFTHSLRFNMLPWVRLALISADIESGQPVIYGQDPSESILEGLLASVSLPPWFVPFHKNEQLIVDGGALSNLPIEPALRLGASEIIALNLDDPSMLPKENLSFSQYLEKYFFAINQRHVCLEKELAEARGVPVHCIDFRGLVTPPTWDFSQYKTLIRAGYEMTSHVIAAWNREAQADTQLFIPARAKQPA